MEPRECKRCGKGTFKEYVLTLSGGGRRNSPKTIEAWLCGDECAKIYFEEKVNS